MKNFPAVILMNQETIMGQGAAGSGSGQEASGSGSGSGSGQGSAGSASSSTLSVDMSMLESSLSSQMFGGGPVSRNNQECDRDAKYRTLDGTCNNLASPKQGASATAMPRLMDNAYSDGKFRGHIITCYLSQKESHCPVVDGIPPFFQVLVQ